MSIAIRRPIGKRQRFGILNRDGFKCQYCGLTGESGELHVDHIIPVSKGGPNAPWNLLTACHACNLGKSDSQVRGIGFTDRLAQARDIKVSFSEGSPRVLVSLEFVEYPEVLKPSPRSISEEWAIRPSAVRFAAGLTKGRILRPGESFLAVHDITSPALKDYYDFNTMGLHGENAALFGFLLSATERVAAFNGDWNLLRQFDLGFVSVLSWRC